MRLFVFLFAIRTATSGKFNEPIAREMVAAFFPAFDHKHKTRSIAYNDRSCLFAPLKLMTLTVKRKSVRVSFALQAEAVLRRRNGPTLGQHLQIPPQIHKLHTSGRNQIEFTLALFICQQVRIRRASIDRRTSMNRNRCVKCDCSINVVTWELGISFLGKHTLGTRSTV